jgi:hypothetical protein
MLECSYIVDWFRVVPTEYRALAQCATWLAARKLGTKGSGRTAVVKWRRVPCTKRVLRNQILWSL